MLHWGQVDWKVRRVHVFFQLESYWPPLETSFSRGVSSVVSLDCSGMRSKCGMKQQGNRFLFIHWIHKYLLSICFSFVKRGQGERWNSYLKEKWGSKKDNFFMGKSLAVGKKAVQRERMRSKDEEGITELRSEQVGGDELINRFWPRGWCSGWGKGWGWTEALCLELSVLIHANNWFICRMLLFVIMCVKWHNSIFLWGGSSHFSGEQSYPNTIWNVI